MWYLKCARTMLACVGLGLFAAQVVLMAATAGLNHDHAAKFSAVLPLILGLSVPAAAGFCMGWLACDRLRLWPTRDSVALAIVFVIGLAMRLAWFGSTPPLEDDYFRYLWDGALVAHGLSPYAQAPETAAAMLGPVGELARAGAHVIARINFPDLVSIYPPVAEAIFGVGHVIAPFSVDGLRTVFLGAELATFGLLVVLLGRLRGSRLLAVLYWWNPLVVHMGLGIAHVDVVLAPLLLGAVLATLNQRVLLAIACIALAAGVKLWPLLLMPLVITGFARDLWGVVRGGAMAGSAALLVLGPWIAAHAALPDGTSGLGAFAGSWANHAPFHAWAQWLIAEIVGEQAGARWMRLAVALAAVGIAVVIAWRRFGTPTNPQHLMRDGAIISAAAFYLSPAQFPWYALGFLPFAAAVTSWPLLLASVTLPTYYLFFPLWAVEAGNWYFFGTAFFHVVPVMGWIGLARSERFRRVVGMTRCAPEQSAPELDGGLVWTAR